MNGLDYLGADPAPRQPRHALGMDLGIYSSILKAAGGVAEGAIEAKEADDAKAKTSREEADKVSAIVAADNAAAVAAARAAISEQSKAPTLSTDKAAASLASAAQERVASGLSSSAQEKRAAAADKALESAINRARSSPKDMYLAELVKQWTATSNKAHGGAVASVDDETTDKKGKGKKGKGAEVGGSWWTRPVVGPVPGYGVAAGGAGVVVGLGFLVRRIFRR
jgi:hypothetical protein